MLEEKNDNLHNADGTEPIEPINAFENGYIPENKAVDNDDVADDAEDISGVHETEGQLPFAPEEVINAGRETEAEEIPAAETANEAEPETPATEAPATEGETEFEAHDDHEDDHAEELPDFDTYTMEQLTDELEKAAAAEKVTSVKNRVEAIRKAFYNHYTHLIDEKRDEYSHENNGDTSGFEYHFPLKSRFDGIYNQYRDKKNSHFKKLQNDLKGNLETREAIVEELKNIADGGAESIKDALKQVNDLRERWKNAGPIPRDKYNHVWNNFHFHIERFYDQLHLDREARDLDFKHNLEQKQKLIVRAEALLAETDINKAFRELQALHKIWKEEVGPVSREHREEVWNQFSDITRQLHDRREAQFAQNREKEVENLAAKQEIIAGINAVSEEKVASHGAWQGQIEKIEALRDKFFKAGKVPAEVNEDTWAAFKEAVRNFNAVKNSFYKDIKKDQQSNLNRKLALVEKANALKDSEDFAATTPVMKQIQEEWKTIGHVPRKFSDAVWKDFKAACNHYFDRLHAHRNEANKDEIEAFDKKKEYLDNLRDFELTGDHKTDLDAIKKHIETWKTFGRVPQARRHIEGKFNKVLDALFEKLSLSKKETDMVRFSNRLEQLSGDDNSRGLQNEQLFIMRKIDEIQAEIFQLENNIQFFTNAKGDNPLVKEVKKNIERHKEELATWKDKLKQIRILKDQPKEQPKAEGSEENETPQE
ncbi:chromosome segregation protein [Flavobacterium akiainvivens]|uniref:Chromosome segregation protein n=1 Tax=Flavobacterium akiainvivens TaxID=1202724 RepID=A0A0M8MAY7_9FLAO|nr:DUF349 domain-containing protein [Flavobacterium akiainvivens]KOS06295.1 chromosome segregation protein [Flavobacterium akiainvivens]SFQ16984.1 protein of unknown function [Flavobacterium akiainvivens]